MKSGFSVMCVLEKTLKFNIALFSVPSFAGDMLKSSSDHYGNFHHVNLADRSSVF